MIDKETIRKLTLAHLGVSKINDENNISSSGNLSLGASGGISLSGGSVSISGSNKVLVQKNKSSYISLEGECYNQSNAVYENGSCRETYEPFTDDDPQNGVAKALAELEYKNELLSLSILGSNVMLNVVMQNDKIKKSGVALKNQETTIAPTTCVKIVDIKEEGYLYGTVERNYNMKVKTATFYGKGSGPSVTVWGRTSKINVEFEKGGMNNKAENGKAPFEIKLFEFETGLSEIEFDSGWSIDTVKLQADAKAGFEGAEAYAKVALIEGETAKIKFAIPFTNKNLEIGATGDLGSIGGGVKIGYGNGVSFGGHFIVGADFNFDIKDKE
ncbi:hypothetical protein [Clostridium sp. VAP51]|uniref:hypothetical protein n=1 Tax=Clostridium sp. VAP51 TaxID=2949978 RepID=UPI00207A38FF|nr:hypothetical protein [Clostridium sp. VAP51]